MFPSENRVEDAVPSLKDILSTIDHHVSSIGAHTAIGSLAAIDAEVDLDEEFGNLSFQQQGRQQDTEDTDVPELVEASDHDYSDWESDEEGDNDDDEDEEGNEGKEKGKGAKKTTQHHDDMDVDTESKFKKKVAFQDDRMNVDEKRGDSNLPIPESLRKTAAKRAQSVLDDTVKRYTNLCRRFEKFCEEKSLKQPGTSAISKNPHPDSPIIFIAWVMETCDAQNPDGDMKDDDDYRSGYSHAEKERAAILWGYQQVGLVEPWRVDEETGKTSGNPIASYQVSKYMANLKRQKVQLGEKPMSSRAVTAKMIKEMYNASREDGNFDINIIKAKTKKEKASSTKWCGGRMRRLLHFVYVISFLCLLRIDETLQIRAEDITLHEKYDEHGDMLEIWLLFRKTHQNGVTKPFYLREFPPELAYLCPIRAYCGWKKACKIKKGYLCRKIGSDDRIERDDNEAMTPKAFLDNFRQNLADINIDGDPYGGHSFRRGGVQWLSVNRRWPLRKICEWGGWSEEFTHLTIVNLKVEILTLVDATFHNHQATLMPIHILVLKLISNSREHVLSALTPQPQRDFKQK
ncbi:hypothetical protein VNI00_008467 [Paramarasmius palmivorus]|uniref:Tyr recombinase domain-containing protein n=1 Tax=Paramarasmius palmivorus TaxID=297713 RepID=A0AAW0CTG0_9AGAR